MDNIIPIDLFAEVLAEDEDLSIEYLSLLLLILDEIKVHEKEFTPNSNDLLGKGNSFSNSYRNMPDDMKDRVDSILTMPLFFFS